MAAGGGKVNLLTFDMFLRPLQMWDLCGESIHQRSPKKKLQPAGRRLILGVYFARSWPSGLRLGFISVTGYLSLSLLSLIHI